MLVSLYICIPTIFFHGFHKLKIQEHGYEKVALYLTSIMAPMMPLQFYRIGFETNTATFTMSYLEVSKWMQCKQQNVCDRLQLTNTASSLQHYCHTNVFRLLWHGTFNIMDHCVGHKGYYALKMS